MNRGARRWSGCGCGGNRGQPTPCMVRPPRPARPAWSSAAAPGQPPVTAEMLAMALSKRSPIDGAWWEDLRDYRVTVLPDPNGGLAGAVATGVSRTAGTGYVLWLAAGDDRVQAWLLDTPWPSSSTRRPSAFWFATAFGAGLEGLPVGDEPGMHAALLGRGFAGTDAWLDMLRNLSDTAPTAAPGAGVAPGGAVTIRPPGKPEGCEVQGFMLGPGLGTVSWLGVAPARRGWVSDDDRARMLGRALQKRPRELRGCVGPPPAGHAGRREPPTRALLTLIRGPHPGWVDAAGRAGHRPPVRAGRAGPVGSVRSVFGIRFRLTGRPLRRSLGPPGRATGDRGVRACTGRTPRPRGGEGADMADSAQPGRGRSQTDRTRRLP